MIDTYIAINKHRDNGEGDILYINFNVKDHHVIKTVHSSIRRKKCYSLSIYTNQRIVITEQSTQERKICHRTTGLSYKKWLGQRTTRQFPHWMKMCHSITSQDLPTNRVKLSDSTSGPSYKKGLGHSTAGKSSLQKKLCHSIAGQSFATIRVVTTGREKGYSP